MQCFYVEQFGALTEGMPIPHAPETLRYVKSPLDTGTASGEWFTLKPDAELAIDQRGDDSGSLTFETAPLTEAHDYLGQPVLTVTLASDATLANLCARLVDIHPDGTATRVSFGVLNLAHRDGNERPIPMDPGQPTPVRLVLDACGYRFGKGHRIRLSLSTAYWPMVLPPPVDGGLTFDVATLGLAMPMLGQHDAIDMKQPDNPDPLPTYTTLMPPATRRQVLRDLAANRTDYYIVEDTGLSEHPTTGLATRQCREETWSISPGDPLSMTGTSVWTCDMQRPDWFVRTVSTARIACTADHWLISGSVVAYEGETNVFEKTYDKTIPRDLM